MKETSRSLATLERVQHVAMWTAEYVEKKTQSKETNSRAPSPRASLGRRTVCERTEQHRPPVSKRYETKVRLVWGFFSYCCSNAQNTHEKWLYNAQGVNLIFFIRACSC